MEGIAGFKNSLAKVAAEVEAATGISARLGIAQAALESGYGGSELSRATAMLAIKSNKGPMPLGPANNMFGFKTGPAWINNGNAYVMMPTTDYYKAGQKMPDGKTATKDGQSLKWPAPFRAYPSREDSYRDWARLMQIPLYVQDGALQALQDDDLIAFGQALGKHYAPNQDYVKRLTGRAKDMGLA